MFKNQRSLPKDVKNHLSPICLRYNSMECIDITGIFQYEYRLKQFLMKKKDIMVRQLMYQDKLNTKNEELSRLGDMNYEQFMQQLSQIKTLQLQNYPEKKEKIRWLYIVKQLKHFSKICEILDKNLKSSLQNQKSKIQKSSKIKPSNLSLKRTRALLASISINSGKQLVSDDQQISKNIVIGCSKAKPNLSQNLDQISQDMNAQTKRKGIDTQFQFKSSEKKSQSLKSEVLKISKKKQSQALINLDKIQTSQVQ